MEVKSLKSTKIYFHAVLRIILSRGQGLGCFFKRCNLRIILLVYMCTDYVHLIGFTQGRGSVWKILPLKTKDCDRPTRTPLVSCDSDAFKP